MRNTLKLICRKISVLMLALLMLAGSLASCSSKTEEATDTEPETEAAETETEAETEEPAQEEESMSVSDEEITSMTVCYLETSDTSLFVDGQNPYYDSSTNTIVFVLSSPVTLNDDDKIYIGLAGDDAFNVSGHYDRTSYPQFETDDGTFGVAVTADESIEAGTYACVLNFGNYQVTFTITIA